MCLLFVLASTACTVEGEQMVFAQGPDGPQVSFRDPVNVTQVIDGDTIEVRINGQLERVRFKGVNAPELNLSDDSELPEPCAEAALDFVFNRIGGQVDLVYDASCGADPLTNCRDTFGRLLAYIELSGGVDLGKTLLEMGLVRLFVFAGQPFDRQEIYTAAEAVAQQQGLGIHGAGCP